MKLYSLWILAVAGLVIITAAGVIAASKDAPRSGFDPNAADAYAALDSSVLVQSSEPVAQASPAGAPDLRRRLNLTEEQARRVEQIVANFRGRTERLRIDLARARLDARETFLEATPDRARLETIARRIGDLQGQLTRARFDMMVELKAVLSPEQWNRFRFTGRPRGGFRGRMR